MRPAFHTVGVIGKYDSAHLTPSLDRLIAFLRARGRQVVVDNRSIDALSTSRVAVAALEELGAQVDLAVVLGGDGTLLSAARRLVAHGVPVVGINLGRLGFLTDIPADSMEAMLGQILDGHYQEEDRALLQTVVVRGGNAVEETLAVNDVVVSKGARGSMVEIEVYVDGQFVYGLRADGLIVATPTGSTAYALSCGGPIVHPSLPALILAPICPHTLSNRPIVLSERSRIEVVLVRGPSANVNFDVQNSFDLQEDDRIVIQQAGRPVRLLHPHGHSHFAMLREKLHWGAHL
ncbi:MAG: NAD kinase [Pseudomonadota bacterium]|nr:NAD kinase [Pseudomonadota bacterium]